MKNDTRNFSVLVHHPFPAALASSLRGKQLRSTETILEAAIVTSTDTKMLLLVQETLLQEVALLALERILRYTPCQRLLWLLSPKRKATMIRTWEQATSWEDGHALRDRFVMTTNPQQTQEAQVCLVTISDIQKELGTQTHTFLDAFDMVLLSDILAHPGPAWSQIVDQCAAGGACVIGLSSTLSREQGHCFFGRVIDATGVPDGRGKRR